MKSRLVVDVVVRQDYVVRFEQWDDITFVHVDVHQCNTRIARAFRADIDTAHKLLGRPVYALHKPEAPLQPKFLAQHGFKPAGFVNDEFGRRVEIFERTLDEQPFRRWNPNH